MSRIITLIAAAFALLPFTSQALSMERYGESTIISTSPETYTGKVISFDDAAQFGGQFPGTHLLLRTADGTNLTIVLGPSWYLEQQGINVPANAQLEVEGLVQGSGQNRTLIANRIKLLDSGKEFILRDNQGLPVWRGQSPQ